MTRESLLKLLSECRSNRERVIAAFAAAGYEPMGFQIPNFTDELDVSARKNYTTDQLDVESLAIYEQQLRWKFEAGQRGEGR